ncbi:prephenate dehydrogenase [Vermiculatibacterium agrestimuris]|uniref:prephenate dehydrogenase n=1 Tax=Vermiculatibacterium agrestimuris TaxID=2941519 RepID=UPI00203AE39D|nr:prephenate dehydrogenase/arogenate dehydrogenase family protein [Vermiculatibacterium agrestimuris]
MKKIVIVGLGLIGGSLALALKGFEDFQVIGVARRQATVDYALEHGVGDEATLDVTAAVRQADVTVLCINPVDIVTFLAEHRNDFKPGSLVTDVCGIKSAIMAAAQALPPEVDFIGCHPMAGTEFSGIEHAFAEMFRGSHLILTPREDSWEPHVALMERMAAYIGCQDVVKTTPQEHDAILAYTSQMMHIIAVSVCDDPMLFTCKGFEGSSFRGCTRVAALDVPLWTQLFSLNAPALTACLDVFIDNLKDYRKVIASGDGEKLAEKLTWSANRKRQMDLPGPDLLH